MNQTHDGVHLILSDLLIIAIRIQTCESASFNEKRDVIRACHLLQSVSPSVIMKLAEAITWETIEAGRSK